MNVGLSVLLTAVFPVPNTVPGTVHTQIFVEYMHVK